MAQEAGWLFRFLRQLRQKNRGTLYCDHGNFYPAFLACTLSHGILERTLTCITIDCNFQEYPFHLMAIKDNKRLEAFIAEWPTLDRLYDREFSGKLLKYWREVCHQTTRFFNSVSCTYCCQLSYFPTISSWLSCLYQVGGYDQMLPAYSEKLQEVLNDPTATADIRQKRILMVARILYVTCQPVP